MSRQPGVPAYYEITPTEREALALMDRCSDETMACRRCGKLKACEELWNSVIGEVHKPHRPTPDSVRLQRVRELTQAYKGKAPGT